VPGAQLIEECPKLRVTVDLVAKIAAANEKVLIFAQWKATQRILQRALSETFGAWPEIINGDVTTRRQELIDAFRSRPGFGALILSPKVAGYGLNLIEANHVIHYTRPWNPAVENQATDRVHRRGQEKEVYVYYPTVKETVEDRLAELLKDKEALARDVLRTVSERKISTPDLVDAMGIDFAS
jgi:SNF2 family DNA or RNA helicase